MSEGVHRTQSITSKRDLFQPEEDDRFADPIEARKKAMDYLARREYGQTELVKKLRKPASTVTYQPPK